MGQKAQLIPPYTDPDSKNVLPACVKVITEIALDEDMANVAEKYEITDPSIKIEGEEVKEFPKRKLFSSVNVKVSLYQRVAKDGKSARIYYSRPKFMAV